MLAAVGSALTPGARSVFEAQVAEIARVQRLPPDWAEIAFYPRKAGSKSKRFPCMDEFRESESALTKSAKD